MNAEAPTQNRAIHNPLLRFRKRANCNLCPLCDACLSDKTLETRCILALIADSIHTNTQLKTLRDEHP